MAIRVWSILRHTAGLTWVALRSLVLTLLVVMTTSAVLAVISWLTLRSSPWWSGLTAVLLVLAEGLILAIALGLFRGLANAAIQLVTTLSVGRTLFSTVFDSILGVREGEQVGERGNGLARRIEQVPFGQANERLHAAIGKLIGEATEIGFFRRKVHALLLMAVRHLTLARFRDEASQHGGIDLLKVQQELAPMVDQVAQDYIAEHRRFWTLIVAVSLPGLTLIQTLLLYFFSPSAAG